MLLSDRVPAHTHKRARKKNLKINLVEKLEEKVATRSLSNMREHEKKNLKKWGQ